MNNKGGFNWFYLVIIAALGMLFYPMLGGNSVKSLDEGEFFTLMKQGKAKQILVYKDNGKADVFLTPEARTELTKTQKQEDNLFAFQPPAADFSVTYGDLKYLQERFTEVRKTDPNIKTSMEFGDSGSSLRSLI